MIFSSKYDMGQRVWSITKTRVQRPDRVCIGCDGTKLVELCGDKYECPACKGKGEILTYGTGWVITGNGKVGKITVEHCAPYYDENYGDVRLQGGVPVSQVTYMLDSTGIGSGTNYDEPNLWPSREEALAECDRRNAAISPDEDGGGW